MKPSRHMIVLAGAAFALCNPALAERWTNTNQSTAPVGQPEGQAHTNENLPDGFEVMERHVAAIGGFEANEAIKGMLLKGTFEFPSMHVTAPITVKSSMPNKMVISIDLGANGTMSQGTDGEVAWAAMPGEQAQVVDGERAKEELDRYRSGFFAGTDPREAYESATNMGIVTHRDRKCYKLKMTTKGGQNHIGLYDTEDGLLRMLAVVAHDNPENYLNETRFSKYEPVGDVIRAHKLDIINDDKAQSITFDSIEINPEFAQDEFDIPGSV